MSAQSQSTLSFVRPALNDCWNRIGVRGDKSCVELKQHLHCRNCPTYSASARALLDVPSPPDYSDGWTSHFAQPSAQVKELAHSVIIFRVGTEWLALPTVFCVEVADTRAMHCLPHRRTGAVLGITNVRGELLVCLSLAAILGLDASSPSEPTGRNGVQRLLVLRRGTASVVFPVSEVHGVHRYGASELAQVPATVGKAQATYSQAVLPWRNTTVGILDAQLVFHTVDRSLA
ncbi:chemotaxis protein CheW [Povalibacter sp.]|uniref:chemotaxis protein CheW n=1 Tax=Povalibacter sp. TaxID=1962978 RepID=UPI002F40419E